MAGKKTTRPETNDVGDWITHSHTQKKGQAPSSARPSKSDKEGSNLPRPLASHPTTQGVPRQDISRKQPLMVLAPHNPGGRTCADAVISMPSIQVRSKSLWERCLLRCAETC